MISPSPDPHERAIYRGYDAVGDGELLAILLAAGRRGARVERLATALLNASGGLLGLARGGLAEGANAVGLAPSGLARVEAALELGRRASGARALGPKQTLSGPTQVAAWARAELGAALTEELWIVAVDPYHAVLGLRRVAVGTATECRFSVRDVLRTALRLGASGFFLVHNHPSGNASPSADDLDATARIAVASRAVGLVLLDHVIVTASRFESLFALGFLDPGDQPSR